MTSILGISAFYHDSAAALVIDGQIVAAAQEERFSRIKHDASFPKQAVDACLQQAGLTIEQLDYVGFYEKPLLKFDRLLETYLSFAPSGIRSYLTAMPQWIGQKLRLRREIRRSLDDRFRRRLIFCEHHESHAASAFFPSPFEEAAIMTMDGVGEWATSSLGVGRGRSIELMQELRFPHSLGLLYSAFTYYTGFRVNSGEYKLMGLAPYGQPRYAQLIRDKLIRIRDDGSFTLDLSYFNYCQGLTMTSRRFHQLFGRGPRPMESRIETLDMDLAASIQEVTEEVVLKTAAHLHHKTGMSRLCLAGGVALNCVANGKLLRDGPFDELWIQPAAGDAGGALGVALLIWHELMQEPRRVTFPDAQAGSLLGPGFSPSDAASRLQTLGAVFETFDSEQQLAATVAEKLADGNVVGRFQGRMEFGPRALGNRSILGDPRSPKMQSVMNLKIKMRESFRPFAPIVLREYAQEFFDVPGDAESPYMLLVFPVADSHRCVAPDEENGANAGAPAPEALLERVNRQRSDIPAVTHVDYSARVQTVDSVRNPPLEMLLRKFHQRTGCPVLINTSFNVRGEPIVATPEDAYRCFMATDIDVLVVEKLVLLKAKQPHANRINTEQHLASFALD
ncbi:carbamoyltransferase [Roseiconus nitratireducens]|uniref:Carbamoyltransferase n=1 Tax=Roseiconus nitratireducens TaxID=2605748 RepID=A0A5M6DET2_9BACT|nr:carbamoyltransferase [Roseiconus nitratireducens]KAA5543705.1 carbamoyltransferase [Roseiconus nitratireducens]